MIDSIAEVYIEKITDNLKARFEENEILEAMNVIIPKNIVDSDCLSTYGLSEIENLASHFEIHLTKQR
ncbi:hypothetical protein DPMN_124770 [Dreissena polymorpha]|uniref:Uncharacterized protein n=1 Tax=Dreissena polymorpha TaxID=45954 RepID=A0A9D4GSQ5_DREPO|nr:hypothetical protein DPMN_124770 [Dreissena polymorpha]